MFLGISNSQLGNYQKAIKNFDVIFEKDESNYDAFFQRGMAKIMDIKTTQNNHQNSEQICKTIKEAKEDFKKAFKLSKTNLESLFWIAISNCELEIFDEAIEVLNEVLAIDSKYQPAYNLRGIAKSELGIFQEAINDFDKAYDLCSDDIEFCKDTLLKEKNVFLFNENVFEDLLAMSKCKHGILSASSLSWWAAFISKKETRSASQSNC